MFLKKFTANRRFSVTEVVVLLAVGGLIFGAIALFVSVPPTPTRGAHDVAESVLYLKDHRTDICFASYPSNTDLKNALRPIAVVPCEKVLNLLLNPTPPSP